MIDLHCHSNLSDGALSPKDIILKAQKHNIRCLSLTDHDTLAGYPAIIEAAVGTGICIVKGIELSVRWKKHDIHILGYGINLTPEMSALIQRQNDSRIERAKCIADALVTIGIEDAYDKACQLAGHNRVGRPHFARLLINEGKSRDMKSAFKQYLGRGKGAYIPTSWVSIQEAIACIVSSGGQAVIAHPLKYGLTRSKLHELINEFIEVGGEGIEVVSGEMTVTEIREMAGICLRFNLLASSGSDYHSDAASRIALGYQQQLPENCTPIWREWNIEQGTL